MKLLAFIAVVVVATVIVWLGAAHVIAERHPLVGDVEWPGGGTLRDFPREFPNVDENESATRFLATADHLPESKLRDAREAMNKYVREGTASHTVDALLETHANTIRTLRAQIISNPPPVWARQVDDILEPPAPPLMLHMRLFALFGCDALAHRSDPAVAWSDLHAAWILARSLWQRPEMMSLTVALSGTRTILAVASKLPPPRPQWWSELAEFNVRKPFVRALEYDAWASRQRAERYPTGEPDDRRFAELVRDAAAPILRPIRAVQANDRAARDRQLAAALMTGLPLPALQRIHRFEMERANGGSAEAVRPSECGGLPPPSKAVPRHRTPKAVDLAGGATP